MSATPEREWTIVWYYICAILIQKYTGEIKKAKLKIVRSAHGRTKCIIHRTKKYAYGKCTGLMIRACQQTISSQFYMLSGQYTFELTNCLGISSSLELSGPLVFVHLCTHHR